MTAQEIFNKVATHLLTQRARSLTNLPETAEIPACNYRGAEGRACAVGCLIPDEMYSPDMDISDPFSGYNGTGVASLLGRFPDLKPRLLPSGLSERAGLDFLTELQYLHDSVEPDIWGKGLRELAVRWGLDASILLEVFPAGNA